MPSLSPSLQARPGEEVEVTGVYTNTYDAALNIRQGFPVFTTVIEANYVARRNNSLAGFNITGERALATLACVWAWYRHTHATESGRSSWR